MVEWNDDGSIKLPAFMVRKKKEKEVRLKKGRCVLVKKELTSTKPKKCTLHLTLSEAILDNSFLHKVYSVFNENSEVPSKIIKLNEKEFDIEIGTHFRRCSDCCKMINRLRDALYDNVIEEDGSCTYEKRTQNFCYEDYFD